MVRVGFVAMPYYWFGVSSWGGLYAVCEPGAREELMGPHVTAMVRVLTAAIVYAGD